MLDDDKPPLLDIHIS